MTDRELLIELLAIKLYEHEAGDGMWPPRPGWGVTAWGACEPEDRQLYRDAVTKASAAEDMYATQEVE